MGRSAELAKQMSLGRIVYEHTLCVFFLKGKKGEKLFFILLFLDEKKQKSSD